MKLYRYKDEVSREYLIGDLRKIFGMTFNIGKGFSFSWHSSADTRWKEFNRVSKIKKDFVECVDFADRYLAWKMLRYLYDNKSHYYYHDQVNLSFEKLEKAAEFLFGKETSQNVNIFVVYDENYHERYIVGNINNNDSTISGVILPPLTARKKEDLNVITTPLKKWNGVEKVTLEDERSNVLKILMHKVVPSDLPDSLFELLNNKLRGVH